MISMSLVLRHLYFDVCYDEESLEEAEKFGKAMDELWQFINSWAGLPTLELRRKLEEERERNRVRTYE